eukprot:snap_masked-scaffold_37-processed-gene-1.38-mRNA-1 protein AED:1.00 eAED:1.00 QI:0/-1/0/0/-1/1/1/0/205
MSRKGSKSVCTSILPLVPILLDFFRQEDVRADIFLRISSESNSDVERALKALYEEKANEDRLTLTQIKYLYEDDDREPVLWASGIITILTSCSPSIITQEHGAQLLGLFKENKSRILASEEECGGILGPVLDELPRRNFEVLGNFLAFIRDTVSDLTAVSNKLGPKIIPLPKTPKKEIVHLFETMVEKSEPLFGRVAASKPLNFK